MKRITKALQGAKRRAAAMAVAASAVFTPAVARAEVLSSYTGASSSGIVSGTKNFIGTIGTYGGGLYAIGAIFTLVLAIRNEDNEGRNKAMLNLLCTIGLLSMGVVLNFFIS